MPHILVPTDFSKGADNALAYAVQLAQRWDAPVRLVHAYEEPYDFASQMENRIVAIEKNVKEKLQLEVDALQTDPALEELFVDYQVLKGEPERCIREAVSELDDGWVIMGYSQHDWLHEFREGHTSVEFVSQSPVPVLIVPEGVPYHRPKEVVFATRFAEAEAEGIAKAAFLAQTFDARLRLVHIAENEGHEEELRFKGFRQEVQESLSYPNVEVEMFTAQSVKEGLSEELSLSEDSWLVLSHEHQSFFKRLLNPSVTKELLEKAAWPTLVFTHSER